MQNHIEQAINHFEAYGKTSSKQALIQGLRSFANALEHSDIGPLAARSAVDILTNDEVAQTIVIKYAELSTLSRFWGPPHPWNFH